MRYVSVRRGLNPRRLWRQRSGVLPGTAPGEKTHAPEGQSEGAGAKRCRLGREPGLTHLYGEPMSSGWRACVTQRVERGLVDLQEMLAHGAADPSVSHSSASLLSRHS